MKQILPDGVEGGWTDTLPPDASDEECMARIDAARERLERSSMSIFIGAAIRRPIPGCHPWENFTYVDVRCVEAFDPDADDGETEC